MGKHVERQRVRTCLKKYRLKTKRLHGFNFGLHGGGDEVRQMSYKFT